MANFSLYGMYIVSESAICTQKLMNHNFHCKQANNRKICVVCSYTMFSLPYVKLYAYSLSTG